MKLDMRNDCESVIAGVQHWYRPNNAATGQSVTLYERHPVSLSLPPGNGAEFQISPLLQYTAENAGNPIADTFAVVARKNSAVLALADGVNWGNKAALASRCAVSGCVEYLNAAIFGGDATAQAQRNLTTQVRRTVEFMTWT